jgi:hypothetical protein
MPVNLTIPQVGLLASSTTRFSELDAPLDSRVYPTSTLGVWRVLLRRGWERSNLLRVAHLLRRIPLRISATVRERPSWGNGWKLPRNPEGLPRDMFLLSCSDCTRQLRDKYPWTDQLDMHVSAEAFRAGAEWAFRNFCTKKNLEPSRTLD